MHVLVGRYGQRKLWDAAYEMVCSCNAAILLGVHHEWSSETPRAPQRPGRDLLDQHPGGGGPSASAPKPILPAGQDLTDSWEPQMPKQYIQA
ncbi:hypothetical protein Psuf_048840 [Phytohabitans suffuscus]|uniref:Uncharacterized protein n=1 Tax=Phytohabitans suffuscus TaxID=624315 RepID=A0A6F8YNM5_9ACTN|nr:hypothetical protein Psuf_048840 [Phytohabitans suffuscus]